MTVPSLIRPRVFVRSAPPRWRRYRSPFGTLKGRVVSTILALVAVLGLALRPACDVLASSAETGTGTQTALVHIAKSASADGAYGQGHDDNDGPCCSSVADGSLVTPLDTVAVAGAGAQPVIAHFPAWRVPSSLRGEPLLAAGPSALLPLAFHARSAPLRR